MSQAKPAPKQPNLKSLAIQAGSKAVAVRRRQKRFLNHERYMVNLDLLRKLPEGKGQTEIPLPLFDQIANLVEKEELEPAMELMAGAFREGIFDIRLIVYFFYGHFLEEGVKSLASTLPLLASFLEERWDLIKPAHRKEKQVENSLNWFFSRLVERLKYSEKKDVPVWTRSVSLSSQEFQEVSQVALDFERFFDRKWGHSPMKERVTHLVKKVADLAPFLFPQPSQQESPPPSVDKVAETPGPAPSLAVPPSDSAPMQVLIAKLKTFEFLVANKDYFKAAMVSQDISEILEHFDPCVYFPHLFSNYFALLAKNISSLADEWQKQDALEWKTVKRLYQIDLEQFVKWTPLS